MSIAAPDESSRDTNRRTARLLGVLASVLTLLAASFSALALSDVAHHDVATGVTLLGALLGARWLLAFGLDEWGESCAERLRARWRRALPSHLGRPRREGERARGDLSLAVEQAAHEPDLERLAASAGASLLGLVVIAWAAGWPSVTVTVALLALAVPLYRRAGIRAEAATARFQERRALLESRQLEVLQRAPELRALGAVEIGAREVRAISDSEHVLALRAIRVALGSSLVTEFLSGVSVGLVAMIVGFALLGGRISLVRALVAVLVTSELFAHVRRYGVEFHRREDARGALAVLRSLGASATRGPATLIEACALVTEAHDDVVDLVVVPGDRVLITGPSGVGKTTLLHTLLGWRDPVAGTATLGARTVGYVGVESALVAGTLRENLLLGSDVSDELAVTRLGELGLTTERFSNLDTRLLADGRGLSTGERVRLVLARALLAGAPLLVLDDVAGVLDADARRRVADALAVATSLAVIEATADTPLLSSPTRHLEVRA